MGIVDPRKRWSGYDGELGDDKRKREKMELLLLMKIERERERGEEEDNGEWGMMDIVRVQVIRN